MLQLAYIRDNKEDVLKRLAIKNFKDAENIINSIIELDNNRKAAQRQADTKAEAAPVVEAKKAPAKKAAAKKAPAKKAAAKKTEA